MDELFRKINDEGNHDSAKNEWKFRYL
jgi:hypothetical protein